MVTGTEVTCVVIAAGGLGTRVSAWSRYLPKEFYPVAGRPGIAHLLDEIAALAPAEAVVVYHPYYEPFAAWARTALSEQGQDSYSRAALIPVTARLPAAVRLSFIPQHGPYADVTSVLNGADHLSAAGNLYVAFADNLYPDANPLAALRAAPGGHVAGAEFIVDCVCAVLERRDHLFLGEHLIIESMLRFRSRCHRFSRR